MAASLAFILFSCTLPCFSTVKIIAMLVKRGVGLDPSIVRSSTRHYHFNRVFPLLINYDYDYIRVYEMMGKVFFDTKSSILLLPLFYSLYKILEYLPSMCFQLANAKSLRI